ncbi:MAG: hypothetical protein M0R46_09965 [Candidatus Muirbacterium halophilum]|nr:hypothetical protein [Candidatus Muirbacterium halophilum]
MKIINKFLIFVSIGINIAFGASSTDPNIIEYKADTQPTYNAGNYTMECPKVKEGYVTRIDIINYEQGTTTCNVYKIDSQTGIIDITKPLDQVVNTNPQTKLRYSIPPNKNAIDQSVKEQFQNLDSELKNSPDLQKIKDKWLGDYSNPSGEQYLTASKYLLAGLTIDGEIINIKQSIEANEITLNNGFTIYPNINGEILKQDGIWNSFFDQIQAFVENPTETQARRMVEAKNSIAESSSKDLIGNIMVMVMDFYAGINEDYQELNFFALILPLAFTSIFAFQNKLTRKFSKLHSQEDFYERGFLGVVVLFIFYFSSTTYNINDKKNIDQNYFNNFSRWFLYQGVDWADSMTRKLADSYVTFVMKDVGLYSQTQIKSIRYDKANKENQVNAYRGIVNNCRTYYDADKIKSESDKQGAGNEFPTGITDDFSYVKDSYKNDRNNYTNIPTMNACASSLRKVNILEKDIIYTDLKLQNFEKASQDNQLKSRVLITSETVYKNVADNGFLSAPLIAGSKIFFDASETVVSDTNELKNDMNQDNSQQYKTVDGKAVDSNDDKGMFQWILNNSVYLMLPGADAIRGSIYSMGESIIEAIPFVSKVPLYKFAGESATALIATIIAISVMVTIVKYLPLMALMVASMLTISFYYISVEIFYLITPFLVAYAFTANQPQVIVNLLMRFFALAIKPVIFVITIVVSMLVINIFDGINSTMIQPMFHMFDAIFNVEKEVDGLFMWLTLNDVSNGIDDMNSLYVGVLGAVLNMLTSIFAVIATFYIIFNGQDMFMSLFGFKERGIDVQEGIGSQVAGDMSKYSKPI